MLFERETTSFPTVLHRDIYMTALRRTPTEISLAEIQVSDPVLAESCQGFYDFMTELLADMYLDPCRYGMHPGAFEEYLNGRKYNAAKRTEPLQARTYYDQSAAEIACYLELIKSVASKCEIINGVCVISEKDFEDIKGYGYLPSRKRENVIPIETVLARLAEVGLVFRENADGSVTVENDRHPCMFVSMSALAKAVDESVKKPVSAALKYFFSYNWGYMDFRQIVQNYKPTYEDFIHFLPDDLVDFARKLRELTKPYKLKEVLARPFMVDYQYKGRLVMRIWLDSEAAPSRSQKEWKRNLTVRVYGSPRAEYLQSVEAHGEAFVKYFFRHLNYCSCCTPEHVADRTGIRPVLGRNVRICADPGGVFVNPTPEDLPFIKEYIDMRMNELSAGVK